jgi:hypothetical protein
MRWLKQGLIFTPPNDLSWMSTHAALPVADISGDICRIYFSGRDSKGRAQIGWFEVNLDNPAHILGISQQPAIGLGPLGAFDDNGVTSCWIVNHTGRKYQYYTGWSLGVTVPFYFYIGLAISDDGGESFHKVSRAPILERNNIDPYLTASPCVLVENGLWRMWYISCTGWEPHGDQPMHYYHIKYAESADGIVWQRTGTVCIDYTSLGEHAFARPCVIKSDGIYKMWYSYRGASYRIGYAESVDGLHWQRKDDIVGIDVSETGWDSEMVAYSDVFEHQGRYYMLYNGNGYGRTGIGLAVLESNT